MILADILITAFLVALCVAAPPPASFTWDDYHGISYLSEVKNQNFPQACNSGWAISTIDMLNSRIKNLRKAQSPDISLSAQVLLSCDNLDFGCMGGEPLSAIRWIKYNNITDDSCHAYRARGYTNGQTCSSLAKCHQCRNGVCQAAENSKIYSLSDYGPVIGQKQMMDEIYNYGPIVCGINSNPLSQYTSGILTSPLTNVRANHHVLVYGWGQENGTNFWRVKNSWGPAWGEKGHFRIEKGKNTLGIEYNCVYSSLQDTWTKDVRNRTLPNQGSSQQLPDNLPDYLTPSRSSLSPLPCNSDWAFATVQMIADRISKETQRKSPLILSVQAMLNCGAGKCSGGSPADALLFAQKFGLPEQGCQPYQGHDPASQSCSAVNNCAFCNGTVYDWRCYEWKNYKRWKIYDYGSISGVENMKNQLAAGPIVCGMHSSKAFQDYHGGIFSEVTIAPKIDHYVEIVSWGSESGKNFWVGRNSWGTSWGESSFFRIQMGGNNLGIENKCYFSKGLL